MASFSLLTCVPLRGLHEVFHFILLFNKLDSIKCIIGLKVNQQENLSKL